MVRIRRYPDAVAIALLVAITFGAVGFRWYYDNWLTEFDIFTFFLPNWSYLGERLREFDVPGWNPYLSGGTPFAGDPSGGWMYLPVMVSFSLFSAVPAIKLMVLLQALIGGISTYWFSRRIELTPVPSLVAALSLAIGPALYGATYFTTVGAQVTAFVALGLLCVESAMRADRLSGQLGWAAGAGIAVSQMFASWPGQGLIYGVLIVGGWMVWRWLVEPIPGMDGRNDRLLRILFVGCSIGVAALLFGAAGILPRIDFSAESNIPGGDYSGVLGGSYSERAYPLVTTLRSMVQDAYIQRPYGYGAAIFLLAVFAVVLGRRKFGVLFFAAIVIVFIDLTASISITRPFLSLVPGFDHIHGHRPVATLWVMSIAPSMLAGAGVQMLLSGVRRRWDVVSKLTPLIVFLAVCLYVDRAGDPVGKIPYVVAILTTIFLLLPICPIPNRWVQIGAHRPAVIAGGLLLLVVSYPTLTDLARTVNDPRSGIDGNGYSFVRTLGKDDPTQETIATVLGLREPESAAEFLLSQQVPGDPFRYAAYAGIGYGDYESYSLNRMDAGVVATLANGRSAFLELEQMAGYNPMHLKYYAEYVTAMNGFEQDYHWMDAYPSAIRSSQLLDMLNVRYVLVDASIPADREDVAFIPQIMQEVYRDEKVIVYRNPFAYSRAWVVHDVREEVNGGVLEQFQGGDVDGRFTAYVSGTVPSVSSGNGRVADGAVITSRSAEAMSLDVTANGDGLLVLSEVYEHNWRAWVDGEEVDVLRTNHALRGVPVTSGEHEVVLKYESRWLTVGMWTTGYSTVALVGIWIWALVDRRRGIAGDR